MNIPDEAIIACITALAACVLHVYRSIAKRNDQTMDEIKQAYFGVQRQQTETLGQIADRMEAHGAVLDEIRESLRSINGKTKGPA